VLERNTGFIYWDGRSTTDSCNGCGDQIRLGVICNERMTEPEFQTLHHQQSVTAHDFQQARPVSTRAAVLLSLRQRMQEMSPEEVVGIAAFPSPVKVRQKRMVPCRNGWNTPQIQKKTADPAVSSTWSSQQLVGNDQAGSC